MSKVVDDRVVEMRFDNKQFEAGVRTSMSTLDKLKQSLKLTEATKGLENLNSAVKNTNFSPLANGVETVRAKFSALQVVGVTALANIANAAMNAGKRIVSALTVEPIMDGFREYETQMGAIQTILANTKSKGSTLDDVNAALAELNTYADKTIYNFTEMTKNIGTFTAAGVGLEQSTMAIKGIANLAAISGSTSAQASSAMYQLSQALAAGRVSLMDWNSVVNAGMGGEVFQNALKRTATQMGTNVDAIIEKYGSFRESLTQGQWLTTEVLTETLAQLSGAYTEADLIAQGYTEQQAKEIVELAKMATSAATEVKTLSQLFDTLKEAVGSGWAQTWQILFGDFEEAKELFTGISDVLGDMIGKASDARNEVLKGWKELGGRTELINSLKNVFDSFMNIVKPIGEAFRDIFPPTTAQNLMDLTTKFKDLTNSILKGSKAISGDLKSTFKGVFAIFDIVGEAVKAVIDVFGSLLGVTGTLGKGFLGITGAIGEFIVKIRDTVKESGIFAGIGETIIGVLDGISSVLEAVIGKVGSFKDVFSKVGDFVSDVFGNILGGIKSAMSWLSDNISLGDIFAGLASGGVFLAGKKIADFFDSLKEALDKFFGKVEKKIKIADVFSENLTKVHDALINFTSGIKITSLLAIATSVGILALAMSKISELRPDQIIFSLAAIGGALFLLTSSFKRLMHILDNLKPTGILKSSISLIAMAAAVSIFADAIKKVSDLPLDKIGTSLIALGSGLLELIGALKLLEKVNVSVKDAAAMVVLAIACKTLGDAMTKFSGLSWNEIAQGLAGMGGALLELTAALAILSKVGGGGAVLGSVAVLIATQSLGQIADALKEIGSLSWNEIAQGLAGMGGALGEFTACLSILGKVGGGGAILGSVSVLIAVQALKPIADALKEIGSLSWEEIARGLAGMGGALGEVGGISGALGKIAGVSGLLGSGSILMAVQALKPISDVLKEIGSMSWEEIARGLVGMGGALAEVGGISGALGKIAGVSGLVGAGTITLAVQGLDELANGFQKFAGMSWEEIGRGLAAMGGALLEISAGSILAGISGVAGLVGAGTLTLAVQGLGELADALQKFGSMSWDEIGRGLAAMGAAMGETALGGLLNTFSGLGALSISTVAEPLGVLADSVKKWEDVKVPSGLALQLGGLAAGVGAFTLSGIGAWTVSTVAEPLGVLADSVKKWSNVTVPEGLSGQLFGLARAVNSFTFGGIGAGSMSAAAGPLGELAGAVKKWSNVEVPENLEDNLKGLANGIKAFSFAFLGGFSIEISKGPLGGLADEVKKWNKVKVPEDMEGKLKGLANGVKAFSFAFLGGFSIDAVKGPLGNLAAEVKKWNGVNIPDGLGGKLKSLANGLKAFNGISADSLTSATGAIKKLGSAVKSIAGIDFASATAGLQGFANSINSISISTDSFSGLGQKMVDGLVSALNAGIIRVQMSAMSLGLAAVISFSQAMSNVGPTIAAGLTLVNGIAAGIRSGIGIVMATASQVASGAANAVTSHVGLFMVAGAGVANGLLTGINSRRAIIISSINSMLTASVAMIRSFNPRFTAAGELLVLSLISGIKSNSSKVGTSIIDSLSGAVTKIRNYHKEFYAAGGYLVQGFADGISANTYKSTAKASAMAEAAKNAAEAALGIESPSKVFKKIGKFTGEGFAIGIDSLGNRVSNSAKNMAGTAIDTASKALSTIASITNGDLDVAPRIRPVVDLTNTGSTVKDIRLGANIDASLTRPIDSLSRLVYDTQAEIASSNREVIGAINDLREDLNALYSGDDQELALYVDSKKLASSLVKPMNRQLSILARRGV